MNKSVQAQSIRQKLLNYSIKKGIAFSSAETTFLIERLVARLMQDKVLASQIIFKGGFVGLKVHESPRYTVDLDAVLKKENLSKMLTHIQKFAELDLDDGVWFKFDCEIDLTTQGDYGGIRHIYRAGIGEVFQNLKKAQTIHLDLGIGDPVFPSPKNTVMTSILKGIEEVTWSVYSVETIVAEKLHALVDLGEINSRSKDVYDLSLLLPKTEISTLKQAVEKSFIYRGTTIPKSFFDEIKQMNTTRLEKGWMSALSSVANPPPFSECFQILCDTLQRAKL